MLGNPRHGVAAAGRNWLVKQRNTLVTREPDHLAKVRVERDTRYAVRSPETKRRTG